MWLPISTITRMFGERIFVVIVMHLNKSGGVVKYFKSVNLIVAIPDNGAKNLFALKTCMIEVKINRNK